MKEHLKIYSAYLGLVALLALTIAMSRISLGAANYPLALLIGGIKAVLIALFFMELLESGHSVKIAAATLLIWSLAFILLSAMDYNSRDWPVNPQLAQAGAST